MIVMYDDDELLDDEWGLKRRHNLYLSSQRINWRDVLVYALILIFLIAVTNGHSDF